MHAHRQNETTLMFDYDAIFSQPKTIFREQATRILKEKRKIFSFSFISVEGEYFVDIVNTKHKQTAKFQNKNIVFVVVFIFFSVLFL